LSEKEGPLNFEEAREKLSLEIDDIDSNLNFLSNDFEQTIMKAKIS
jgi:hypothetical protein